MWPRRGEHEMRLFELAFLFDQNRSCRTRFAWRNRLWPHGGATFTTVKRGANQLKQTLMIDVSGRGYDEIAVGKLACMKADGGFVIESRNCFPRAFDWTAEWLGWGVSRGEEVSGEIV